jgi:hypothetical protein
MQHPFGQYALLTSKKMNGAEMQIKTTYYTENPMDNAMV